MVTGDLLTFYPVNRNGDRPDPTGTYRLPPQRLHGHPGGDEPGLRQIGGCPRSRTGHPARKFLYTTGHGDILQGQRMKITAAL